MSPMVTLHHLQVFITFANQGNLSHQMNDDFYTDTILIYPIKRLTSFIYRGSNTIITSSMFIYSSLAFLYQN